MTFASVYEMMHPLSQERKTHFWDWFDGDALDSIWTERDVQGTGTFAMDDAVDGGFKITCGSNANDQSRIDFDNIQHYEETGCVFISRVAISTTINQHLPIWGFTSDTGFTQFAINRWYSTASATDFSLSVYNGTGTNVATGIAKDTNFHIWKIHLDSTVCKNWDNGVLVAIATSNFPTVPLSPVFRTTRSSSGGTSISTSYCEAYNI